jgi:hypothetical protein
VNKRNIAAAGFFVAYLAMQVVVPIAQAKSPCISRFGWQMFSRPVNQRRFTIVTSDGWKGNVDAGNSIGNGRSDINFEADYPPFACRSMAQADRVQWVGADGQLREFKCP